MNFGCIKFVSNFAVVHTSKKSVHKNNNNIPYNSKFVIKILLMLPKS